MSEKQRTAHRAEEAVREASPWVEQFALVGSFLVVAALRFNPGKAGSLDDAFQTLLRVLDPRRSGVRARRIRATHARGDALL
jgi:hypothetical protein